MRQGQQIRYLNMPTLSFTWTFAPKLNITLDDEFLSPTVQHIPFLLGIKFRFIALLLTWIISYQNKQIRGGKRMGEGGAFSAFFFCCECKKKKYQSNDECPYRDEPWHGDGSPTHIYHINIIPATTITRAGQLWFCVFNFQFHPPLKVAYINTLDSKWIMYTRARGVINCRGRPPRKTRRKKTTTENPKITLNVWMIWCAALCPNKISIMTVISGENRSIIWLRLTMATGISGNVVL